MPHSNCNPDPNHKYTRCIYVCYNKALLAECGCHLSGEPFCKNRSELECDDIYYNKFIKEMYLTDKCLMKCTPRCDRTYYELSPSYLNFPTNNYARILMNNKDIVFENMNYSFDVDHLKQNMISIQIMWKNMEYTLIEETPTTTLLDLISNIGGLLGKLFILV